MATINDAILIIFIVSFPNLMLQLLNIYEEPVWEIFVKRPMGIGSLAQSNHLFIPDQIYPVRTVPVCQIYFMDSTNIKF